MSRKPKVTKQYRSTLEDTIVPGALARGAVYEPVALPYAGAPRRYTPDLVLPNGIVVEIKGWFTPADRAKTLAVLRAYPGLELRFVFQRAATKLNPRSKTTYARWCDDRAIPWAERDIPASWYAEPLFPESCAAVYGATRAGRCEARNVA